MPKAKSTEGEIPLSFMYPAFLVYLYLVYLFSLATILHQNIAKFCLTLLKYLPLVNRRTGEKTLTFKYLCTISGNFLPIYFYQNT